MKIPIYMDNHATTPVDPRVLEAMLPYFKRVFGNPASRQHSFGWAAEGAVETARTQVAKLINADPNEIFFTSGATESDNLATKGVAWMYRGKGNHIVTLETEHSAVLDSCKRLESEGFKLTYLPVKSDGRVDLANLEAALTDRTILVTVMAANNEIGVLQPVAEVGKRCRERNILFHTDAVQAVGKIPIDVEAMNIDLLSISGHKIYGPKGIGAIYVRSKDPSVALTPLIHGGGHERGVRSGTLNVPGSWAWAKRVKFAGKKCRRNLSACAPCVTV
jgi:cysteine desulfurase